MELKEYIELVRQRYQSLSDEEKVALETIGATPAADALAKMFGPEMSDIAKGSQETSDDTRQMLESEKSPNYSAGPNPNRVDPMTYRNTPDIP